MKRFLPLVSCLIIALAGFSTAFAACKQLALIADDRYAVSSHSGHDHDHDSSHGHSDESLVHCPTVDQLVSRAVFSTKPDRGSVRVVSSTVAKVVFRMGDRVVDPLSRSPSAFAASGGVPSHLFHSVLLI